MDDAAELLRANWVDLPAGGYTRPTTDGLYPHQWNWDSAFAALGWATVDPDRAYTELASLAAMQDPDGMIPHLAFSPEPQHYFPNADWWPPRWGRDGRRISAISQPPVAATCLRLLFERHPDAERAAPIAAALHRWHAWWLRDDGPVIGHPWGSGRDNAPDWDGALEAVPELDVDAERDDTRWVGVDQRPLPRDYGRYAYLVMESRCGEPSSFAAFDPGVGSALALAASDLAWLAEELGDDAMAAAAREHAHAAEERLRRRATAALDLRDAGRGDGLPGAADLKAGRAEAAHGAGWALNVLRPGLGEEELDRLEDVCVYDQTALASPYGVRSWPRTDPRFDARRYWRGPVWASITWLCALGFERHGRRQAAAVLRERFAAAVDAAGFREFVDGDTGEGLGATGFTWTAALFAFDASRRVAQRD